MQPPEAYVCIYINIQIFWKFHSDCQLRICRPGLHPPVFGSPNTEISRQAPEPMSREGPVLNSVT